jgi:hypothetical protein
MKWSELESFINKVCRKNVWKVEYLGYDILDLKQEAWLVYNDCMKKYNGTGGNKQFFAYFKMAFLNKITNLSQKNSEIKEHFISIEETNEMNNNAEEEILFKASLSLAPESIKRIINILENPPKEYETRLKRCGKGVRGVNSNKLLCDMLKIPVGKTNVLEYFKDYIRNIM